MTPLVDDFLSILNSDVIENKDILLALYDLFNGIHETKILKNSVFRMHLQHLFSLQNNEAFMDQSNKILSTMIDMCFTKDIEFKIQCKTIQYIKSVHKKMTHTKVCITLSRY